MATDLFFEALTSQNLQEMLSELPDITPILVVGRRRKNTYFGTVQLQTRHSD